jgi:hypothetical protein
MLLNVVVNECCYYWQIDRVQVGIEHDHAKTVLFRTNLTNQSQVNNNNNNNNNNQNNNNHNKNTPNTE